MSGRIQILVNATVRDVRCHKQCTHFQDIGMDQFCCMAFNYCLVGRAINGDPLRLPQCITAEKRANKLIKAAVMKRPAQGDMLAEEAIHE